MQAMARRHPSFKRNPSRTELTRRVAEPQNRSVIRRLVLAVLFCLAAWMLADRTFAESAGRNDLAGSSGAQAGASAGASIGSTVATPPIDTHPPEARWESLLPQGIGGGSSRNHQPQLQAVDLPGGVSNRAPWAAGPRAHAARDAARFRPPFLLHTPLLI